MLRSGQSRLMNIQGKSDYVRLTCQDGSGDFSEGVFGEEIGAGGRYRLSRRRAPVEKGLEAGGGQGYGLW